MTWQAEASGSHQFLKILVQCGKDIHSLPRESSSKSSSISQLLTLQTESCPGPLLGYTQRGKNFPQISRASHLQSHFNIWMLGFSECMKRLLSTNTLLNPISSHNCVKSNSYHKSYNPMSDSAPLAEPMLCTIQQFLLQTM